MGNKQNIHIMEGDHCVYVLPYGGDPFPKSFTKTELHPIRPYCKRVTLWIFEVDRKDESLKGLRRMCTATLGEQFERLQRDLQGFDISPKIDDVFYFLLGTQAMTFYCENSEGKRYKVTTDFESIKSSEWKP